MEKMTEREKSTFYVKSKDPSVLKTIRKWGRVLSRLVLHDKFAFLHERYK